MKCKKIGYDNAFKCQNIFLCLGIWFTVVGQKWGNFSVVWNMFILSSVLVNLQTIKFLVSKMEKNEKVFIRNWSFPTKPFVFSTQIHYHSGLFNLNVCMSWKLIPVKVSKTTNMPQDIFSIIQKWVAAVSCSSDMAWPGGVDRCIFVMG